MFIEYHEQAAMSTFYLNIKFSPGCTYNLKAITFLCNFCAIVKSNVNCITPPGVRASVYFKHQTDQIKIVVMGVFYKITDFH